MGIYGFGKAFNTRYVNSGQFCKMPHVNIRPQRPMFFGGHSCQTNTNVTINNGPQGFWGFMSGLFSTGFFGNLLGLFGFGGGGMGMGMGMGMPMMGGMSPFGMLNQTQMFPQGSQPKLGDRLNDLKTLYPNWNIVSDGNGHYDATSKDGTIHHEGDFDQMCELLKKEKESQGAPSDVDDGGKGKAPKDENPPKDEDPSGNAGADPAGAAPGGNAGGAAKARKRSSGSGSGTSLQGWYRADTQSNEGKNLQLSKCKSASAVLEKLLTTKVDYLGASDRAALCRELIKANPSVFNSDGTVKANANFDKLDVPSIKYIKDKYVGKATYNKANGTVSYNSQVGNGQNIGHQNSTVAGAGGRTIKGNNGYYVKTSKSGNIYYDPHGNKISAEVFKKVCPSIYASVNKTSSTTNHSSTASTNAASHPANNGKTHVGSRQPWI